LINTPVTPPSPPPTNYLHTLTMKFTNAIIMTLLGGAFAAPVVSFLNHLDQTCHHEIRLLTARLRFRNLGPLKLDPEAADYPPNSLAQKR
jgi:hypothetical protein